MQYNKYQSKSQSTNITSTYHLLDHQEQLEIRVIKPATENSKSKVIANFCVSSDSQFVAACEKWETKANIYVGSRERKAEFKPTPTQNGGWISAKKRDIVALTTIPVDIDAVRPEGLEKQATTETELQYALDAAEYLRDHFFADKGFIPPTRAMSGNGVQLWCATPRYEIPKEGWYKRGKSEYHAIEDAIRALFDELTQALPQSLKDKVKIDPIHDLTRIIKIIGTTSVKGDPQKYPDRPHRVSYFIDEPVRREDADLLKYILDYQSHGQKQKQKTSEQGKKTERERKKRSGLPPLPEAFRQLLLRDRRIHKIWSTRPKRDDLSAHDWKLGLACIEAGITKAADLRAILMNNPHGKYKRDRREDYVDLTVDKLLASCSQKEKASSSSGSKWASMEDVLSEIRKINDPTPEKIQKRLWDFVADASYWNRADLGRFCDILVAEYRVTKTWLGGWSDAVTEERRKRGESSDEEKSAIQLADELIAERFTDQQGRRLVLQHDSFYESDGTKYVELLRSEYETAIVEKIRREIGLDVSQNLVTSIRLATQPLIIIKSTVEAPYWKSTLTHTEAIISMRNGLLDLDKYIAGNENPLLPHTPDFFVLSSLLHDYDPSAECPRWMRFLDEALSIDPDLIWILQEFYGLCQTHDTRFHHFLFLQGDSRTGKGVAFEVLQALTGYENVANVPLRQFGSNFGLQPLIGKKLNINAEVPELDEIAEDILKEYCGGSTMLTYNRKHKESISTRQRARLAFSSNHFPNFRDRSDGIWNRMLLITFQNIVSEEKRDPDLANYLIENELSGIFNWALEGYTRLVKNGGFTDSITMRRYREDYRDETNPVRRFLKECTVRNPESEVTSKELYDLYVVWARAEGHHRQSHVTFGRDATAYFKSIGVERKKSNSKIRFVGVEINPDVDLEIQGIS